MTVAPSPGCAPLCRQPAFLTIGASDLEYLYKNREFPRNITAHSDNVVVLMTQDWCPQWQAMRNFLPEFTAKASIFVLVYNRHEQFSKILAFKENTFGNRDVPYLRFYRNGVFFDESNYIGKSTFSALIGTAP